MKSRAKCGLGLRKGVLPGLARADADRPGEHTERKRAHAGVRPCLPACGRTTFAKPCAAGGR
ncbi:hypothetical protein JCM4814A_93820 [Streptomyces phaeofaciens JCM 4814]|uniref:Uncharacterized protein n=1 Tax=Streptomyces phaeofaciens TaxID=68254 RepID=A0A918HQZ0_9ACTN|nr:hypothetical protein GCM10010226_89270 [Streptomyces phaeofaciens]